MRTLTVAIGLFLLSAGLAHAETRMSPIPARLYNENQPVERGYCGGCGQEVPCSVCHKHGFKTCTSRRLPSCRHGR